MPIPFRLDLFLIKNLAEDIEASNVTRNQFDLGQLVSRKPFLYGAPGSEKRRAVQKKFAELKRKTPGDYFKFLGKVAVLPGQALKRELIGNPDMVFEEDEEEDRTYECSSDEEDDEDDSDSGEEEEPFEDEESFDLRDIEIETRLTPSKTVMTEYSSFSGSFENSFEKTVLKRVELLEKPQNKQDGSLECPYIHIVDPEKPETGNGFEVALVPQVRIGNFMRSVFHIRRNTTQGMEDEWLAKIPRKEFPALAHRSVLIRGPSQELWHRRPDLYHQDPICDQTETIHEIQQTAINMSLERKHSHWLLVLPKGTILENHIISHDSIYVSKGTQELVKAFETEDDDGNVELTTLYGMDVYWRIAEAGGHMVTDPALATKKRRKRMTSTKL